MDLGDARRLVASALVLSGLLLLWLLFLWLADRGSFVWTWPERGLAWVPYAGWLWIGAGVTAVLLFFVGYVLWQIPLAPDGYAAGSQRQVQCLECRAVFLVHDTGHRPLTHICPNCKSLGVYDGHQPSVGEPQARRPQQVVELDLTCQQCHRRFQVTDTGMRPMVVHCPECKAVGTIR